MLASEWLLSGSPCALGLWKVHIFNIYQFFPCIIYYLNLPLGKELAEGKIAQQKFTIQKSLTKSPTDYPDKKSQPHVQVKLLCMIENIGLSGPIFRPPK